MHWFIMRTWHIGPKVRGKTWSWNSIHQIKQYATIFTFVIWPLKDILECWSLKRYLTSNLISRTLTKVLKHFLHKMYSINLLFGMKEKGLTPKIRDLERSNVFFPQLFTKEYFLIY